MRLSMRWAARSREAFGDRPGHALFGIQQGGLEPDLRAESAEALREILKLYDFRDSPETRAVIDALKRISTRHATARAPEARMGAVCRGLDVTLELDGERFSGTGLYLFASVLERFLALYAAINSFTRLSVRLAGQQGVWTRWPPRSGDRILL